MSQRLHNCINNTNLETIQCETYANKLQRRGKFEPQKNATQAKTARDRSTTRNSTAGQLQNSIVPLSKNRTTAIRQNNELKSESTAPNIIHKELYADNSALVEVTVKAHNSKQRARSRSNSRARNRDPWCKLLKSQMSYENLSTFNNFDPLRTLHFLARELQNKLNDSLPYDKSVQQMIVDMQVALSRIPPEVASTVVLYNANDNFTRKASSSDMRPSRLKSTNSKENVIPPQEKLIHMVKPATVDKYIQTINNYAESEKLQRHLEESSTKIEMACRQMETVCTRLKSEKEELETMLRAEKETVKFLRKQIEEFENERVEVANVRMSNLKQENDSLTSQVKKLKVQIESQQGPSSQDLKSLVQELRQQKFNADEQVTLLNHQLTLLNMEKEKYVAILSARDRQIKEIRCEMNQLQDVVNEQLVELQNAPSSSVPSSLTNITNEQPSWLVIKNKDKFDCVDNFTPSSVYPNDSTLQNLFIKDKMPSSSFKEIPSGDSSGTSTSINDRKGHRNEAFKQLPQKDKSSLGNIAEIKIPTYSALSETNANIRDMFAEIKKQALLVTAPMPSQKMNDIDMYRSEQSIKK